jgi:hypothetical protein
MASTLTITPSKTTKKKISVIKLKEKKMWGANKVGILPKKKYGEE